MFNVYLSFIIDKIFSNISKIRELCFEFEIVHHFVFDYFLISETAQLQMILLASVKKVRSTKKTFQFNFLKQFYSENKWDRDFSRKVKDNLGKFILHGYSQFTCIEYEYLPMSLCILLSKPKYHVGIKWNLYAMYLWAWSSTPILFCFFRRDTYIFFSFLEDII